MHDTFALEFIHVLGGVSILLASRRRRSRRLTIWKRGGREDMLVLLVALAILAAGVK